MSTSLCRHHEYACARPAELDTDLCRRHLLLRRDSRTAAVAARDHAFHQCNYSTTDKAGGSRCTRPTAKTPHGAVETPVGFCAQHIRSTLALRRAQHESLSQPLTDRVEPAGAYLAAHYGQPGAVDDMKTSPPTLSSAMSFDDSRQKAKPQTSCDELTTSSSFALPYSRMQQVAVMADCPLQNAGAYSHEEVVRMLRDKMLHLQSLYMEEAEDLRCDLVQTRTAFKRKIAEEITKGQPDIESRKAKDIKEKQEIRRTLRLRRFRRHLGEQALLRAKQRGKQIGPQRPTCEGEGCFQAVVPFARFCSDHILNDERQCIFTQCNPACAKVVVDTANESCLAHSLFPTPTSQTNWFIKEMKPEESSSIPIRPIPTVQPFGPNFTPDEGLLNAALSSIYRSNGEVELPEDLIELSREHDSSETEDEFDLLDEEDESSRLMIDEEPFAAGMNAQKQQELQPSENQQEYGASEQHRVSITTDWSREINDVFEAAKLLEELRKGTGDLEVVVAEWLSEQVEKAVEISELDEVTADEKVVQISELAEVRADEKAVEISELTEVRADEKAVQISQQLDEVMF